MVAHANRSARAPALAHLPRSVWAWGKLWAAPVPAAPPPRLRRPGGAPTHVPPSPPARPRARCLLLSPVSLTPSPSVRACVKSCVRVCVCVCVSLRRALLRAATPRAAPAPPPRRAVALAPPRPPRPHPHTPRAPIRSCAAHSKNSQQNGCDVLQIRTRMLNAPVLCSTRAPPHPIPRPHLSPLSTPRPSRARARRSTRARSRAPSCMHAHVCGREAAARSFPGGWRGPVWLRGYALGAARARARRVRCWRFPRARSTAAQRCPDSVGPVSQRQMEGSPIDQSKRSDRKQRQSVRSQTTCEKHVGGWGPTRRVGGRWRGGGAVVWHTAGETARAPHSHV